LAVDFTDSVRSKAGNT